MFLGSPSTTSCLVGAMIASIACLAAIRTSGTGSFDSSPVRNCIAASATSSSASPRAPTSSGAAAPASPPILPSALATSRRTWTTLSRKRSPICRAARPAA